MQQRKPDWTIVWQSEQDFIGEPLTDPDRWREEEILSVYAQELPPTPGQPSPLHVWDFRGLKESCD